MIGAWYTLRALAREWDPRFNGAVIADVFSADRDELTLLIDSGAGRDALRISVRPSDRHVFRQGDGTRPRRNVTTLMTGIIGRQLARVVAADRDRVLDLVLDDGTMVRTLLFGPRANVLHVGTDGTTLAAFREKHARTGQPAPQPQPAPDPEDPDAVHARWPGESMDMPRAISRAYPLFDKLLAEEVALRAGLSSRDACLAGPIEWAAVSEAATALRDDLNNPRPVIYRDGKEPVAFSLVPLSHPPAPDVETFDRVDDAVRVFVRAALSHRAFRSEYDPLQRTIETVVVRNTFRRDRMLDELTEPSRADRYEKFGHLLMADGSHVSDGPGQEEVTVADVFEGGAPITIPLDASRSVVENANRYYEKARVTRRAREEAESRLDSVESVRQEADRLLCELLDIGDRAGLKQFSTRNEQQLGQFRQERGADTENRPFRRYDLGHGYEVWVGRNARENDELTMKHARKHDLWMHARGVAGSHVVLRNPRRDQRPPRAILMEAASIAARFSKASGSELVPVIVAERRHVRKPRGAAPGAVVVEREEVLLVEPRPLDA